MQMPNERGLARPEAYTHGYQATAKQMADRTAESHAQFFRPHLKPGMKLLDCGCGPGTITAGLARAVDPGQAVGVDIGDSEIGRAKANAAHEGVSNASFRTASAYDLPFSDNSFDAVFSHAMLEHVREPDRAVKEMYRVLKTGGVIGLRGTIVSKHIWHPESAIVAEAYSLWSKVWRRNGGNPDFGVEQADILRRMGFSDLRVSVSFDADLHEGIGTIIAPLILQPNFVKTAEEQGWADERTVRRIHDGLVKWSKDPHALWFIAWSEVVAWKR
jgi:ubiquinone/menaquinone biosynthesis C-methylase UbiE